MDGWIHGCMDGWMHACMHACNEYCVHLTFSLLHRFPHPWAGETRSHQIAEPIFGWGSCSGVLGVSKLITSCHHVDMDMEGVKVHCLVDTDSVGSTITESFFHQHFELWGQEHLQSCHCLRFRAASGLAMPYIGYLKLSLELCGKVVLVVKDPHGNVSSQVPND